MFGIGRLATLLHSLVKGYGSYFVFILDKLLTRGLNEVGVGGLGLDN